MIPYLTPELKVYYLDQLEKCRKLALLDDPDAARWAMDPRLEEHMAAINRFRGLQTMLSLFPRTPQDARMRLSVGHQLMYVQVAYAEAAEEELMRALDREATKSDGLVIHNHGTVFPNPAVVAADLPDALKSIDHAADQHKYLAVRHVMLEAWPVDCGPELSDAELLAKLNDAFAGLVKLIVDVGIACEGDPEAPHY